MKRQRSSRQGLVAFHGFSLLIDYLKENGHVFDNKSLKYALAAKACSMMKEDVSISDDNDMFLFFHQDVEVWSKEIDLDDAFKHFVGFVMTYEEFDPDDKALGIYLLGSKGFGRKIIEMIARKEGPAFEDAKFESIWLNSLPEAVLFYLHLGFKPVFQFSSMTTEDKADLEFARRVLAAMNREQRVDFGKRLSQLFEVDDEDDWPTLKKFQNMKFDGFRTDEDNERFNRFIYKVFQESENNHPTFLLEVD